MVTFTRGDGANLTQRAEVLRSGFEPDATTVYNTSLELLQVRRPHWGRAGCLLSPAL